MSKLVEVGSDIITNIEANKKLVELVKNTPPNPKLVMVRNNGRSFMLKMSDEFRKMMKGE